MGLFTSKIVVGVLAGGFSLAGAGLLFDGSATLENASNYVKDAGSRLTQYESNENSLLAKFNTLKTNANANIEAANTTISNKKAEITQLQGQLNDISAKKAELETQIETLNSQIASLQADLQKSNSDLDATKTALANKTAQYDQKVAELNKANKTIVELTKVLAYVKEKAVEADKHVTQLEGELQKANTEVAAHGEVVEQVKTETESDQPLTSGEVDAIDTTVDEVDTK